jgi:uncharacterized UBP type Zn finger protein
MQKCIYCKTEIHDDRPLTVCDRCGIQVWGEKMFFAILGKMIKADENGNLNLYKDQEVLTTKTSA